jgi:hypothetical protein
MLRRLFFGNPRKGSNMRYENAGVSYFLRPIQNAVPVDVPVSPNARNLKNPMELVNFMI